MQYRVRRRWAHPILSIAAAIIVLIFAPIIWLTLRDPAAYGEGVRIFIPPFCLFLYLALALALNYRVSTVSPASVLVSVLPIPMRGSIKVCRNDIRLTYARMNIVRDEDLKEISRNYSAGVETTQGRQVDITGPQPTLEMALERAEDIARILNAGQQPHAIPAVEAPAKPEAPVTKATLLLWTFAFMALVLIGGVWEAIATSR